MLGEKRKVHVLRIRKILKGVMPISTITKTWSEDKSDGVFNANDICKIVDGVAIPYKTKRR